MSMEPLNPTWSCANQKRIKNEAVPRHHGGVCVLHRKLREMERSRVGLRYESPEWGCFYYIGDYEISLLISMTLLCRMFAVSYRLGDASNLRLAYQMRIWAKHRTTEPLPQHHVVNEGELRQANLESEKNNSVSLSLILTMEAKSEEVSLYLMNAKTTRLQTISFSKTIFLHSTYANIGHLSVNEPT